MSLLAEIKQDAAGAALLADWLGDGGLPVKQLHAERRARVCVFGNNGQPCPLNKEPNWWERFKGLIADTIKSQLALKHRLTLSVSSEAALSMCGGCGCCLKLKVWTPIEHIRKHYDFERMQKAPEWCWQKIEVSKLT